MAHEVFISYSIKDRLLADTLCNKLEEDNIRCWIAPRDISPGGSWAGEIADAVPSSKIMILLFSANSNDSKQVLREVELAITYNLIVIPMKIEDVMPTGGMSYYLSTTHWIDAIGKKFDKRIETLSLKIQVMLEIDNEEMVEIDPKTLTETTFVSSDSIMNKAIPESELIIKKTTTPKDTNKKSKKNVPDNKAKKSNKELWVIIPIAIIVIIILVIWVMSEWIPDFKLSTDPSATPPVTNWKTLSPSKESQDTENLQNELFKPEDFGYDPYKKILIEDKALLDAIVNTLNSTRENNITSDDLTIEDMFQLRYLAFCPSEYEIELEGLEILDRFSDIPLGDIYLSRPESLSSLTGLQYAANLIYLSFENYKLDDEFELINGFKSLRYLKIKAEGTYIPGGVSNQNLIEFHLECIPTEWNFYFFREVQNLEKFYFKASFPKGYTEKEIKENLNFDIPDIKNTDNLRDISLIGLRLTDIGLLSEIEGLTNLDISSNNIKNLSEIVKLKNLKYLSLAGNPLESLSPLLSSENLIEIILDESQYAQFYDETVTQLISRGSIVYKMKLIPQYYNLSPNDPVNFGDNGLEEAIKEILINRGRIIGEKLTISDMFELDNLIILHDIEDWTEDYNYCDDEQLNEKNIVVLDSLKTLEGIQFARSLKALHCEGFDLNDISQVSHLENLRAIIMPQNKISDISFISDMQLLRGVNFDYNYITDINPLSNLQFLSDISLTGNQIMDISTIASTNYQHLHNLYLANNLITDISHLTNLTNLEWLNLGGNPITDFSPLENFEKLSRLDIEYSQYINNHSLFDKLESTGIEIFVRE